eukprot:364705-Chlamydomonas_euryale.AAC.7
MARAGARRVTRTLDDDREIRWNAVVYSSELGRSLLQMRGMWMAVTSSWPKSITSCDHSICCMVHACAHACRVSSCVQRTVEDERIAVTRSATIAAAKRGLPLAPRSRAGASCMCFPYAHLSIACCCARLTCHIELAWTTATSIPESVRTPTMPTGTCSQPRGLRGGPLA